MKLQQQQLPMVLLVCLICQVLYRAFATQTIHCTAREMLFGGLCAALVRALGLFALSLLGLAFAANRKAGCACATHATGMRKQANSFDATHSRQTVRTCALCAVAAVVCLVLLLGVAHGMVQQVQLYYRQFGAGALWVLLCACLVCQLHCAPHALLRCARLLLLFCVFASIAAVIGLASQSSWHNLSAEALTMQGLFHGFWAGLGVYPEYLAIVVCGLQETTSPVVTANAATATTPAVTSVTATTLKLSNLLPVLALPFCAVAVQFFMVLCSELIFGVPQAGVGGFEFLRSWAFLRFSRFDGLVVLLWLLLSFFRLRFLCFLVQQANPFGAKQETARATKRQAMGQTAQQVAKKHRADPATGGVE